MESKRLSIALCMALIFLALWYGRDPSVFCAALAVVIAVPCCRRKQEDVKNEQQTHRNP